MKIQNEKNHQITLGEYIMHDITTLILRPRPPWRLLNPPLTPLTV